MHGREMGTTYNYRSLPIRDAMKCVNQKVNIVGFILEFGLPKRTRGTDYCCVLKVIDESHQPSGMSVNIFAEDSERLPHVVACGDVIQLCNVMVKTHGEEVNAVFNKKFSSFALFNGKDNDAVVPYQVSSNFHPRDVDKMSLVKLRKWLVNFQLCEDSSKFPMLREMKEGDYSNLVCKILHYFGDANHEWMAFVWDGTDLPPNSITAKLEDEMCNPLPLHLELEPLSRELLCTFPTVGSILRIRFDQGIEKTHLKIPDIGKWVKIVNMRVEVHSGLWLGVLTPFTKFRYTPDGDDLILQRQRLYDGRVILYDEAMSFNWKRAPFSSLPWPLHVTVADHDYAPFLTLMDVLTHSEVVAKFRCIVRVVAAMPWPAENFRSPQGIYRMQLTIEDPTARLRAFVYKEDGETLFDGYHDNSILTEKMNLLLGVGRGAQGASRNPPWAQLCLKSYYKSAEDMWGTRQFRIFDTKIVGA